ncbi:protein of unknown function [Streptomyces sp. KY70]|nr:protein of unknown function [Streptomyces sp. KY70]
MSTSVSRRNMKPTLNTTGSPWLISSANRLPPPAPARTLIPAPVGAGAESGGERVGYGARSGVARGADDGGRPTTVHPEGRPRARRMFRTPYPQLSAPADGGLSVARIRVLVVDDHRIFAESLAAALAAEPDVDVAAAGNGPAALRALERAAAEARPYDVILVDAELGGPAPGAPLLSAAPRLPAVSRRSPCPGRRSRGPSTASRWSPRSARPGPVCARWCWRRRTTRGARPGRSRRGPRGGWPRTARCNGCSR